MEIFANEVDYHVRLLETLKYILYEHVQTNYTSANTLLGNSKRNHSNISMYFLQ